MLGLASTILASESGLASVSTSCSSRLGESCLCESRLGESCLSLLICLLESINVDKDTKAIIFEHGVQLFDTRRRLEPKRQKASYKLDDLCIYIIIEL